MTENLLEGMSPRLMASVITARLMDAVAEDVAFTAWLDGEKFSDVRGVLQTCVRIACDQADAQAQRFLLSHMESLGSQKGASLLLALMSTLAEVLLQCGIAEEDRQKAVLKLNDVVISIIKKLRKSSQ